MTNKDKVSDADFALETTDKDLLEQLLAGQEELKEQMLEVLEKLDNLSLPGTGFQIEFES